MSSYLIKTDHYKIIGYTLSEVQIKNGVFTIRKKNEEFVILLGKSYFP